MSKLRKLYKILYYFHEQMMMKNISSFAASTAFFLFVSLIPILYLVCSILPYTGITEETFLVSVEHVMPGVVGTFFGSIVSDVYNQSAGVISLAVLVMVWSAGKGMLALMRGLNEINEVEEKRNYILVRLIAAFYTVIMVVAVVVSVLFSGLGRFISRLLIDSIPGGGFLHGLLGHFRFLYSWLILTALFMLIYTYVPGKKQRFFLQFPGAVFSAVIWSCFSIGFSVYIEYFGDFGAYGSLATVVIVLLWLYCMSYIVMIGANINRYLEPANKLLWKKWRLRRKQEEKRCIHH